MSEYQKISTAAEADLLDMNECLDGYRAGLWKNATEPGSDKSKSYWHGWRNAQIDKGVIPCDWESGNLARELIRRERAH